MAPEEQDELGAENLAFAARALARIGGTVLVEPVSGASRYPLLTAEDALGVMERVQRDHGIDNLGLLADLYHLAVNGDDVDKVVAEHTARIAHVQIADDPGRNEPGTGKLPLDVQLSALEAAGYSGWVGLEYKPSAASGGQLRVARPGTTGAAVLTTNPTTASQSLEEHMSNIAFIGLGIMGLPMSIHLAEAGHTVTGYNRSPERVKSLVDAGGNGAESVAEAVEGAEVVCVMVPDSPDVQDVLTGEGGVFENAKAGTLVVDFSSIRPDVTVQLAQQAHERGLRMLDAPVSGGEAGAKNAALSIMVGGDAADFDAVKPYFDVVGKTVVHVGPSGSGQTVKAANQLIVAANIQALAEAVVFLEAYGVDTAAALDVLGGGLAGSKVLDQKRGNMLDRSFEPGFRIELHHKDLGIVTAASREAGVVIPLGSMVVQLMASAKAVGDGGLDHSALLRGVERLSGR